MIPIKNYQAPVNFSVITISIILVNIFVFWQEMQADNINEFILTWSLVPQLIDFTRPETFVTFITSQFLHAGVAHIFFNMLFLYIFGRNIEQYLGSITFLIFYLASGIVASLIQMMFILDTTTPMLGASGAVAGVLGAYWVLFAWHKIAVVVPPLIIPIRLSASIVLFLWFAVQLFNGVAALDQDMPLGGVAWWAHSGGFIFGVLIACILPRSSRAIN